MDTKPLDLAETWRRIAELKAERDRLYPPRPLSKELQYITSEEPLPPIRFKPLSVEQLREAWRKKLRPRGVARAIVLAAAELEWQDRVDQAVDRLLSGKEIPDVYSDDRSVAVEAQRIVLELLTHKDTVCS